MEEIKKNEDEGRESYILQISFWQPSGGPVRILAKDEAHAKELLPKLLPGVKDIEIHDISLEKNIQAPVETKAVEPDTGASGVIH